MRWAFGGAPRFACWMSLDRIEALLEGGLTLDGPAGAGRDRCRVSGHEAPTHTARARLTKRARRLGCTCRHNHNPQLLICARSSAFCDLCVTYGKFLVSAHHHVICRNTLICKGYLLVEPSGIEPLTS